MQFFNNLSLRNKLMAMVVTLFIGLLLVQGSAMSSLHNELLSARKEKVQEQVETTISLINHFYEQRQQLGESQSRQLALEAVRALRYGSEGYMWINDMQHRLVMHPKKPEEEGRDMTRVTDADGRHHWQAMVTTVASNGAGFVDYTYIGPQFDRPQQKVSYVQGFAPWGWVVGSGVYLSDVNTLFWQQAGKSLGLLMLVVLLALALIIIITRSLTFSVARVQEVIARFGKGDLGARTGATRTDEIGQLSRGVDAMGDQLCALLTQVREAATLLDGEAEGLSVKSKQTRASMQSQFNEVDQVATAMNEMNATVHEVARHANDASAAAEKANQEANMGHDDVVRSIDSMQQLADSVGEAGQAMQELESQTRQIDSVVEVIRNISEQTNLLALNAAIEAARAGESGRGFAVVADEVRSLALRTQESTGEIQRMIQQLQSHAGTVAEHMTNSQEQAAISMDVVRAAGRDLEQILNEVQSINDMNAQIATASEEQSAVAEEINRNLININEGSREALQVADLISESSQRVYQSSNQLTRHIAHFKLERNDGTAARREPQGLTEART
ncbi:methyl-accepting chemotaxis sensory transducer with Cache sensor [Oceanimonas sp. GK1]|uniref:methyl-accepting chemotaxis protein n=1 Tax=Oceanimonas sp. (strain GK1 / IBRC-M 10197) TaxID=511062 RepID=UPI0002494D65|nr:methyl-accepting chemotaxis protein [Oceanimonas sp. GK1]AEX99775.1 methyl-accepting chemotaxis sensory transducer with Cache sensor [Oceanimonas sp. GK1]